jgi:hypothetical protein
LVLIDLNIHRLNIGRDNHILVHGIFLLLVFYPDCSHPSNPRRPEIVLLILLILTKLILIIDTSSWLPNPVLIGLVPEVPHIKYRRVVPIARRDTPPPFKHYLPYTRNPCQQVAHHRPVTYIPHLEVPI